jgi:retron-type reverse transcriptase
MSIRRQYPFYFSVYRPKSLRAAWRTVYENGISSTSAETQKRVRAFSVDSEKHISQISKALRTQKFKFDPADGLLIKKIGKKPRPIVLASIPNRVVQRSILDVLQEQTEIKAYYEIPCSFGGIKHKSVRHAIAAACGTIARGSTHFLRSAQIMREA